MGAIKVNNTDVAKVYVGGTEVSKIYVGGVLVWEKEGPTPPVGYSNKIYGHTRSASQTLTIKVNGVSHSVTSGADKYFEYDCTGTTITDLAQCLYNQANLNDVVFDIDTTECTNFSYLVGSCAYGTGTYDCSKLIMSKSTNSAAMFYNDQQATIILPSAGWAHGELFYTTQFIFYNCKKITDISLVGLGNCARVTTGNGTFQGCTGLKTLDFSGVTNYGPATYTNYFQGCSLLESVKVEGCDTATVDFLLARLSDAGFTFTKQGDYLLKT